MRWRPVFAFMAVVFLPSLIGLSACGSYRGIAEFTLYQSAFDKTNATASAILDQLAVRERKLFVDHHPESETRSRTFEPDLAAFYSDTVDPPGTGAFRRSLVVVKTYNDLLYGLASGQTPKSLVARLGELEANVGKATTESANLLTALRGAPQLEQLTILAKGLDGIFTQLSPFIEVALSYRSREEFRRYLSANYPLVRVLLQQLRNGTQVIFPVLTAETLRPVRSGTTGILTPAQIDKITTHRRLLSDWVVLIDATILALDRAQASATAPPTLSDSVVGLNSIAVDLEATAQAARKHLAELATK